MSTIRVAKSQNFTTIANAPMNDDTLSWKAKGILAYLLTKPDNWKVFVSELCNHSTDGRDSTASGIKELIDRGYISRSKRINEKSGHFEGYEYIIYESCNPLINPPLTDFPFTDDPFTGEPFTEKPKLLNTDVTKNGCNQKLIKRKPKKTATNQSLPSSPEEVELYAHENGYEGIGEAFYNYYKKLDWKDKNGKPVKNWKAKCRNVWFTDERKIKPKRPIHYGLPEDLQKSIDAGESA